MYMHLKLTFKHNQVLTKICIYIAMMVCICSHIDAFYIRVVIINTLWWVCYSWGCISISWSAWGVYICGSSDRLQEVNTLSTHSNIRFRVIDSSTLSQTLES